MILRDIDRDGKLDSNQGNNYVADICTSIIRVNIANLSLNDVLTKRDDFKSKVREELSAQCEGWGAWIETVEISDVQVASKKLFEDLQCEFRIEQKLKAERMRLETETKLQQEIQIKKFEENKKKAVLEAEEAIAIASEELKKEQRLAENLEAQSIIRKLRLQREETMKLDQQASERRIKESDIKNKHELKTMEIEGELLLIKQKNEAELALQMKEDERIQRLDNKNLMVLQMEHTESIYRNVEKISLNSFIGDKTNNDSDTPASMLPGMGALMATSSGLQVLKTTNSGIQ